MRLLLVPAVLVLGWSTTAFAELVTNGGFEDPDFGGSFTKYTAPDSTSLTGWVVSSGSVDHIGTYWTAAAGSYSLDLNGSDEGVIYQDLATVSGQRYRLSFYMSGNLDEGATTRSMQVDVGSGGGDLSQQVDFVVTSSQTTSNMGWQLVTYSFIASSDTTRLQFTSLETTGSPDAGYGAVIDEVSVVEIPEPSALLLFGAGLAGLGFWRRRSARAKKRS